MITDSFPGVDATHDSTLQSWVLGANAPKTDFPIQNLPFGRFLGDDGTPCMCTAIGDDVLDLESVSKLGLLTGHAAEVLQVGTGGRLDRLMNQPRESLRALRVALSSMLDQRAGPSHSVQRCLRPQAVTKMLVPVAPSNFSDFFTSIHHASNSARISARLPLLHANFHYLPVAYHGRASSVVVSGTQLQRPYVQYLPHQDAAPIYGPTSRLDFECELGALVGQGTEIGDRLTLEQARHRVFGLTLLNDWSARDTQRWESTPLGPFLAKSFMTTLSPWIVTMEALAPFRTAAVARHADNRPLPHLDDEENQAWGGIDVQLSILMRTQRMREADTPPRCISRPNFKDQYWTVFQMLTHQTSNGCSVLPGDLLGTGTISGADETELGCLLELTEGGKRWVHVGAEKRHWLENGDEVILHARCEKPGYRSIGFGTCEGTVVAAERS
jgi:fumarylacetoacetase